MIEQVLNEGFVRSVAEAAFGELQLVATDDRRGSAGRLDDLDLRDIQDAAAELADPDRRSETPPMTEEVEAQAQARQGGYALKDDRVYLPRNPLLSIVQTALEEAVAEDGSAEIEEADGRRGGGGADPVTDRRVVGLEPEVDDEGRRAFGRFEVTHPKLLSDPRWIWAGVVIAWNRFKRPAPFSDRAAEVQIAEKARLLLVGDWGSGLPRAQAVAGQMRRVLAEGSAARREQHVIHLGDVYYTGGEREYKDRFLAFWPVDAGQDAGSYTLMGNHDMYQGGHGYFDVALADPRFARQQRSSVFALRNNHWQILALDTAYEDAGLHGWQASWVLDQLAAHPSLRTMLLSHHPLFSAYEPGAKKLCEKIAPALATGRVDAWFWGHEHRCLTYDEHRGVRFASCIGHGGIPEYLIAAEGDPYRPPLRYDYRKRYGDGPEPWDTFGFAVVDFLPDGLDVRYIDETGTPHHEERVRY